MIATLIEKSSLPVCLAILFAICAGDADARSNGDDPNGHSKPLTLKDRSLDDYSEWNRPSVVDRRPASDFEAGYANDAGDAFFYAPGVRVNALDIHEPRIVIRGFALGSRLERSTVPVFRDGAPLTDVHGTANSEEIDLLAVRRVEIIRGVGDLRFSGDNLGGAVNFVSPTGRDGASGLSARADGGASIEGTPGGRLHAKLAGEAGGFDYFASTTGLYETGFRDNNERAIAIFNGNIGYQFSQNFTTRFFVEALKSKTELAGGLSPADAAIDPSQSTPAITIGPLFPGGPVINFTDSAETDNFGRDLVVARIANQTGFRLFNHKFEVGGHYARRYVDSPLIDFIGVVDETAGEWGGRLAIGRELRVLGLKTHYRVGGSYSTGLQHSDRFENLNGEMGLQLVDTEQRSTNLSGFVEMMLEPLQGLLVDFGGKFIMVDRELTVDNTSFEELRYIGAAARAGVAYKVVENLTVFANAARAFEPPSFSELIANSPTSLSDLSEQDAFTYEAGLRGKAASWIGWDITFFNSDIENEIINIDDPETNGLGAIVVNAQSTVHRGVEAGVDIAILANYFARFGGALTLRNVYAYNDFRFNVADPIAGADGNRLGGVPEHVYRGELRFDSNHNWFAGVNVEVAAGEYYADHVNEVSVPTHTLVGFTAGWRPRENIDIFVSGENLTDQEYAAGVVPVTSQNTQNGRIFTPGNRAFLYAGLRYGF